MEFTEKLLKIKAFAMDIDGVITDGSVLVSESGKPLRNFNEKDGFALRLAATQGYRLACITGGSLEAVRVRMKAYGVPAEDVYMHSCNKIADFRLFCEKYGLAADEVLYMGDDLPDLPVIMAAGLGVAPADAAPEVLSAADYVTPCNGGRGVVRNTIELVLRAQGKWVFDVEKYARMF